MRIFKVLQAPLVLAICGMFLILAAGTALLSGGVYRSVAALSEDTYSRRAALSYVANQVHGADYEGGLGIGTFAGQSAVVLSEGEYQTVLYCYDGQLTELYAEAGLALGPEAGTPILPVRALHFAVEEGLLICRAELPDGSHAQIALRPNCGITEVGEI